MDATSSKYLTDRAVGIQVHARCLGGSVSALCPSPCLSPSMWRIVCHSLLCKTAKSERGLRSELLRVGTVQRIVQCGGLLSTSQMALFQLVGDAKSPTFKTISAMAKEMRADPLPIVSNL